MRLVLKRQNGIVAAMAVAVGTTEPALKLLISLLAGYPIALVYRLFVQRLPATLKHLYFAAVGMLLCYYNYGRETQHSLISVVTAYILAFLFQGHPKILVPINFIFHMGYLLIGYYKTESNDYDIIWTMPHCVLVLRMIGFAFDLADSQRATPGPSDSSVPHSNFSMPSLLELLAFAYFPASFLIGPQFSLERYQQFISGHYRNIPGSTKTGLKRAGCGFFYLVVRQYGSSFLPDSYLLSESFRALPIFKKVFWIAVWGKISLYKYVSCWLLVEGALMCIGFSYSEQSRDWYGCSNVKVYLLETGNKMNDYIESFNVNTNAWISKYIYKRLKFMNNRTISYIGSLTFLALWHGFHSGYYVSFLLEFLVVTVEKQVASFYEKVILRDYGEFLTSSVLYQRSKYVILKIYNLTFMGFCLVPFVFLSYKRWNTVLSALNYFVIMLLLCWMLFFKAYKTLNGPNARLAIKKD